MPIVGKIGKYRTGSIDIVNRSEFYEIKPDSVNGRRQGIADIEDRVNDSDTWSGIGFSTNVPYAGKGAYTGSIENEYISVTAWRDDVAGLILYKSTMKQPLSVRQLADLTIAENVKGKAEIAKRLAELRAKTAKTTLIGAGILGVVGVGLAAGAGIGLAAAAGGVGLGALAAAAPAGASGNEYSNNTYTTYQQWGIVV